MALIGKLAGKAFSKTAAKAAPKVVLSLSEEMAQQAADVLRQNNAAEKADNLEKLYELVNVSDTDTKAAGRVVDLTDKFNRGGLVSRK